MSCNFTTKTKGAQNELAYAVLLEKTIRTNPHRKAERLLEKAIGVTSLPNGDGGQSDCTLSRSININRSCIDKIKLMKEHVWNAYCAAHNLQKPFRDETLRQVTLSFGKTINFVNEVSLLARKINDTAMGLQVVTDFFRNPLDLSALDFSSSGRVKIPHFSSNEATLVCLGCVLSSAKLLKKTDKVALKIPPSIQDTLKRIRNLFMEIITELKDSSELANHVFRVLIYSGVQGKTMLQNFLITLRNEEINDIITELQILRRQYDEITILLEKLGQCMADILSRCSGQTYSFEALQLNTVTRAKLEKEAVDGAGDVFGRRVKPCATKAKKIRSSTNVPKKTGCNEERFTKQRFQKMLNTVLGSYSKLEQQLNCDRNAYFNVAKLAVEKSSSFSNAANIKDATTNNHTGKHRKVKKSTGGNKIQRLNKS